MTTFDAMLDEATARSKTGFVHAQIRINDTGTHIIVWDAEPAEIEDPDGIPINHYGGEIIAAGSGRDLNAAVDAVRGALTPPLPETVRLTGVTRVVVVDYSHGPMPQGPSGRLVDISNIRVEVASQDEDRTMKIFLYKPDAPFASEIQKEASRG